MPETVTDPHGAGNIIDKVIINADVNDQNIDVAVQKVDVSRVPEKLSEKERILLLLLHDDPWQTKPQLAGKMNVSRKTITVYLKSLKDRQIITRIGSDRKGYWQINQELLRSLDFLKKVDEK